jgi:hypothetical protein
MGHLRTKQNGEVSKDHTFCIKIWSCELFKCSYWKFRIIETLNMTITYQKYSLKEAFINDLARENFEM